MKYTQRIHTDITDALLKHNGYAPWMDSVKKEPVPPFNPITGTEYKGVNTVMLQCNGYVDPRWLTFKQISDAGYSVKKGAHAVTISHSKIHERTENSISRRYPIIMFSMQSRSMGFLPIERALLRTR